VAVARTERRRTPSTCNAVDIIRCTVLSYYVIFYFLGFRFGKGFTRFSFYEGYIFKHQKVYYRFSQRISKLKSVVDSIPFKRLSLIYGS